MKILFYKSTKYFTLNAETSNARSSLIHDGNERVSLTSATAIPIKCSHSYIYIYSIILFIRTKSIDPGSQKLHTR